MHQKMRAHKNTEAPITTEWIRISKSCMPCAPVSSSTVQRFAKDVTDLGEEGSAQFWSAVPSGGNIILRKRERERERANLISCELVQTSVPNVLVLQIHRRRFAFKKATVRQGAHSSINQTTDHARTRDTGTCTAHNWNLNSQSRKWRLAHH